MFQTDRKFNVEAEQIRANCRVVQAYTQCCKNSFKPIFKIENEISFKNYFENKAYK